MATDGGPILYALLLGILPVWLCAGLADWWCHRRQDIAQSSGPVESILHLLMTAQIGIGILIVLYLQFNALILALLIGLCILHQATAIADSLFASKHRLIGPVEQHVHSVLDAAPAVAVGLLALQHLPQTRALFGIGDVVPDYRIALVERLPPLWLVLAIAICGLAFSGLPFLQELCRGLRATSKSINSSGML